MKNYAFQIAAHFSTILLLTASGYASADAESEAKRCNARVGEMYEICSSVKREYKSNKDCDAQMARDYDRCAQALEKTLNSRFNTDGTDATGRFQPIAIPQR